MPWSRWCSHLRSVGIYASGCFSVCTYVYLWVHCVQLCVCMYVYMRACLCTHACECAYGYVYLSVSAYAQRNNESIRNLAQKITSPLVACKIAWSFSYCHLLTRLYTSVYLCALGMFEDFVLLLKHILNRIFIQNVWLFTLPFIFVQNSLCPSLTI